MPPAKLALGFQRIAVILWKHALEQGRPHLLHIYNPQGCQEKRQAVDWQGGGILVSSLLHGCPHAGGQGARNVGSDQHGRPIAHLQLCDHVCHLQCSNRLDQLQLRQVTCFPNSAAGAVRRAADQRASQALYIAMATQTALVTEVHSVKHCTFIRVLGAHMYKDHGPGDQCEGVDGQPCGIPVCHKGADVRQLAYCLYDSCSQRQQFLVQLEPRPALQHTGHRSVLHL